MARYPISEWGCIIEGGQNSREEFFNLLIENVKRLNPPETTWKFEEITTKGLSFLPILRKRREFLTFRAKGLKDYTIDVCADPFGNTLAVHVALCTFSKPRDWEEKKISWEDQTVLSDWSSVIFRCVQDACRELMRRLEQNPELLRTDIRGILSLW